jgi:hypothetical protein
MRLRLYSRRKWPHPSISSCLHEAPDKERRCKSAHPLIESTRPHDICRHTERRMCQGMTSPRTPNCRNSIRGLQRTWERMLSLQPLDAPGFHLLNVGNPHGQAGIGRGHQHAPRRPFQGSGQPSVACPPRRLLLRGQIPHHNAPILAACIATRIHTVIIIFIRLSKPQVGLGAPQLPWPTCRHPSLYL